MKPKHERDRLQAAMERAEQRNDRLERWDIVLFFAVNTIVLGTAAIEWRIVGNIVFAVYLGWWIARFVVYRVYRRASDAWWDSIGEDE